FTALPAGAAFPTDTSGSSVRHKTVEVKIAVRDIRIYVARVSASAPLSAPTTLATHSSRKSTKPISPCIADPRNATGSIDARSCSWLVKTRGARDSAGTGRPRPSADILALQHDGARSSPGNYLQIRLGLMGWRCFFFLRLGTAGIQGYPVFA